MSAWRYAFPTSPPLSGRSLSSARNNAQPRFLNQTTPLKTVSFGSLVRCPSASSLPLNFSQCLTSNTVNSNLLMLLRFIYDLALFISNFRMILFSLISSISRSIAYFHLVSPFWTSSCRACAYSCGNSKPCLYLLLP